MVTVNVHPAILISEQDQQQLIGKIYLTKKASNLAEIIKPKPTTYRQISYLASKGILRNHRTSVALSRESRDTINSVSSYALHFMAIKCIAKRTLLTGTIFLLVATSAAPLLAAVRQSPGLYEFTVTTEGKANVSTHCVTPEDARAVNADEKTGREYAEKAAKGTCSVTTYEAKGDTILLTLSCGGGERSSKVTYHGESFEGQNTNTFLADGKRLTRISQIVAKRVGDCK